MTPLRQRMIEDMQLRSLSKTTQDAYVRAVRRLAEHYGKSPEHISPPLASQRRLGTPL
jgi:integrase/recombinase XerD